MQLVFDFSTPIVPQTGTRCRFCGIEGHTAPTCTLKQAADRELATEKARRQRLGIDYVGGVRINIRRAA